MYHNEYIVLNRGTTIYMSSRIRAWYIKMANFMWLQSLTTPNHHHKRMLVFILYVHVDLQRTS